MSKRTQRQQSKQVEKQQAKPEDLEPQAPQPALVGLEVPLMEIPAGYISRHVEVQRLSHAQARTLKRIQFACLAVGVRLVNGKQVKSGADTVRWLLEQVEPQEDVEAT